jgi:cytochrome c-type biogenesis protein CcmE
MTQPSWTIENAASPAARAQSGRLKFVIAGAAILIAVVALVYMALTSSSQFYLTVGEYYADPEKYSARDFRVSAWVDGETIQYTQIDNHNSRLEFEIVDNLQNPGQRMRIVALNQPVPDLLQDGTQAVVEGRVGADGAMYVNPNGLLLKCPTRYEDAGAHPESIKLNGN